MIFDKPKDVMLLPLARAVLCVDCDTLSRGLNNRCELCGSQALLSVSQVLNRQAMLQGKPDVPILEMGVA